MKIAPKNSELPQYLGLRDAVSDLKCPDITNPPIVIDPRQERVLPLRQIHAPSFGIQPCIGLHIKLSLKSIARIVARDVYTLLAHTESLH
jgi:hypothetical protein